MNEIFLFLIIFIVTSILVIGSIAYYVHKKIGLSGCFIYILFGGLGISFVISFFVILFLIPEDESVKTYVFNKEHRKYLAALPMDITYITYDDSITNIKNDNKCVIYNQLDSDLWIYGDYYYPSNSSVYALKYPPLPKDIILHKGEFCCIQKEPDYIGTLPKHINLKNKQKFVVTVAYYNDSLYKERKAYREFRESLPKDSLENMIFIRAESFEERLGLPKHGELPKSMLSPDLSLYKKGSK